MLNWFRKSHKRIARSATAAAVMLWFATALAPCVMAAPMVLNKMSGTHCPQPTVSTTSTMDAGERTSCEGITPLDCQLPDENLPTKSMSHNDFTGGAALFWATPVTANLADTLVTGLQQDLYAIHIPRPPLILQYGVFLN